MPTQTELDKCYMQVCESHAELSKAKRAKVGACLVLSTGVLLPSVNGLPQALGNELETQKIVDTHYYAFGPVDQVELKTKPEVIHAELGCIVKAALEGISTKDSTLYVSLSPCRACSSLIIAAGIREVIYKEAYRDAKGLDNLKRSGILIRQFPPTSKEI